MWSTVELREIRVFLTLAEELHFGRTGERLQLTSSRVSQVVRALEAKLDAQLVHRTSRRVELTARGESFRDEVAGLHEQLMAVLERTHADGHALTGTLRLGLFAPAIEGPRFPAIMSAHRRRHPGCALEVSRAPYGEAFDCLRRGELDLLVSWLPHGQPDLVVGPILAREPRVVAVAQDHPLAGRRTVSLEEIADYRVLPAEEIFPRQLAETWAPRKAPGGRAIRRLQVPMGQMLRSDASQLRTQMAWWIASGEVVHLTVASGSTRLGPNLVYIPISDMPDMCSALVWPRGATDRRLRDFVRVAEEVLRP